MIYIWETKFSYLKIYWDILRFHQGLYILYRVMEPATIRSLMAKCYDRMGEYKKALLAANDALFHMYECQGTRIVIFSNNKTPVSFL